MLDLTVSMEELKELEAKYASLVKGQSMGDNIIGEMGYGEDLKEIREEIAIREERMGTCPSVYGMSEEEKRIRITALRKLVKEMHLKESRQERKIESLEKYTCSMNHVYECVHIYLTLYFSYNQQFIQQYDNTLKG